MELPVSDLQPGMTVCEEVLSSEKAMLVKKGAILTERLISLLQEKEVPSVRVKAQRPSVAAG